MGARRPATFTPLGVCVLVFEFGAALALTGFMLYGLHP